MSLEYELSHTRQRYREIFGIAHDAMRQRLEPLKDNHRCDACKAAPDFAEPLHDGCGYADWYREALAVIENEIARDILTRMNHIEAYKKTFSCHMCGVCCRFASSEFSYAQLREKAAAGDRFAGEFTSIFLPYASVSEARERFPQLVDDVLKQAGENQDVYFYHCPYIGEDNRCTIYGTPKRPGICASYPDTPLTFIYDKCAWKGWKDETHDDALQAHASIELCSYYVGRLKDVLGET